MGGQTYVGLHEKGLLLLSDFNQRWSVSPLKERPLYVFKDSARTAQ
jgi:hypothetical protein